MISAPIRGSRRQRQAVAICLGLVFLLHPVTTYVVVYIWQRMALFAALFFFLAMAAYLATRTGRIAQAKAGYVVCVLMFFLAMASKENAIALPVVLLLVEIAFFNASLLELAKRSTVFLSVVVIVALALSFVEHPHGKSTLQEGILSTVTRYYEESGLTLSQVAMGQCVVFFEYLKMVLCPLPSNVHLISAQLVPSSLTDPPVVAAAVAGVAGIIALPGIYLLRRRPLVGFGTLFFVVNLLPEAFLVPQHLFFGYRVLIPMFGLLLIAADGMLWLMDRPQHEKGKLGIKVGLACTLAFVAVALGYSTHSKGTLWMDPVAFWRDVVDRLPPRDGQSAERQPQAQALNNLGWHLHAAGNIEQAADLHRKAIQTDPRDPRSHVALAAAYAKLGRLDDAAEACREALRINSGYTFAHFELAEVLLKQRKLDQALQHFRKAAEGDPKQPDFNYGIATVLLMQNDVKGAWPYLQRTIEFSPRHTGAHYFIGKALLAEGRDTEAVGHFNTVLAVTPEFWMAHNDLGMICTKTGKLREAVNHFRRALEINPRAPQVRNNLESALATLGSKGE